jgi:hypothetical protein
MILKSQSAAVLMLLGSVSLFALNPPQNQNQNQNRGHAAPPAKVQNNAPRPGKWLQQHLNDSPQQQQRELQNDNDFKRLTPEQQQHLLQRLNQFNSLPPQQRQRMAQRMRAMESTFNDQERSTLKGLLDSGFNPEENNGGPRPQ